MPVGEDPKTSKPWSLCQWTVKTRGGITKVQTFNSPEETKWNKARRLIERWHAAIVRHQVLFTGFIFLVRYKQDDSSWNNCTFILAQHLLCMCQKKKNEYAAPTVYVCVNMLKIRHYTLVKSLHTWDTDECFYFPTSLLCLHLKSSRPLPLLMIQTCSFPTRSSLVFLSLTAHPRGVKAPAGDFPVPWEQTGKALARHGCLLFPVISLRGTFSSDINPLKINTTGGCDEELAKNGRRREGRWGG